MTDKIVSDLLVDVQKALYLQSGIATQVYAQDQLVNMITTSYELLYAEQFWKRFMSFQTFTLNGTTGFTTTPVANSFVTFEDIMNVFPGTSDVPLTAWTMERNPTRILGGAPLQYLADVTNIIKVLPVTATGTITILGRTNPLPPLVNLATMIPFDHLALRFFTCWQYAVDDGANPAMVKKFQALYSTRLKQLKDADAQAPIAINGRAGRIPTTWEEY